MKNRISASAIIAILLMLAFVPHSSVVTAEGFDWTTFGREEVNTTADAGDPQDKQEMSSQNQKNGNSFVRAIGAPFRALGRLFGGKKKTEQSSARKISDGEAAKFESAKILRVRDARSESSEPTPAAVVTDQALNAALQTSRELLSAGKVNEAIAELTAAETMDPKSGEVQNLLGIAYGSKGMTDRALKSFERAVKSDKNNSQFLNNYGFLLLQIGEFESALKHLKRADKLSPNDPRILNNLAVAQCQRGKFDEALASFVKAVGEFDGRVNMAAQLLRQGMGQASIQHLEVAHTLHPDSIEVLTKLAGLYNMTGRIADAETARRSLLALQASAAATQKQ
jgi:Flp pilus assembly protein TadD